MSGGKIQTNQSVSQSFIQSVSHTVNFAGVYTIYVCSDLSYLVSALKVIWAIYFIVLPSSQKFRGMVFVIVIFCEFYNIRFSCCVKDIYPGTHDFFFSSANAHALSSRRSRWRNDMLGRSDSVVFKCINISDVNIE
jgi:hypothetical protein